MTTWQLYLLTRLESFNTLFQVVMIISAISSVMVLFIAFIAKTEEQLDVPLFKKVLFTCLSVTVISSVIFTSIPTNKDLAIIFAGRYLTNSDEMKKLPDNAARVINNFLDQYKISEKDDK